MLLPRYSRVRSPYIVTIATNEEKILHNLSHLEGFTIFGTTRVLQPTTNLTQYLNSKGQER